MGNVETEMNLMAMDFVVASVMAPDSLCSTLVLGGQDLRRKKNQEQIVEGTVAREVERTYLGESRLDGERIEAKADR